MDLLRGKKDKDKTATTVHPKETKQDEGGDVGNVAVNSEEKEKKLHMYLAETFMNLGNVYKVRVAIVVLSLRTTQTCHQVSHIDHSNQYRLTGLISDTQPLHFLSVATLTVILF